MRTDSNGVRSVGLALATRCLSFDYVGTNPDDASEEAYHIQIPGTLQNLH